MPLARIRRRLLRGALDDSDEFDYSEEYELLSVTDRDEFVLRDGEGNVTVFDAGGLYTDIEIQCENCGQWAEHVTRTGENASRWLCHGGARACNLP